MLNVTLRSRLHELSVTRRLEKQNQNYREEVYILDSWISEIRSVCLGASSQQLKCDLMLFIYLDYEVRGIRKLGLCGVDVRLTFFGMGGSVLVVLTGYRC